MVWWCLMFEFDTWICESYWEGSDFKHNIGILEKHGPQETASFYVLRGSSGSNETTGREPHGRRRNEEKGAASVPRVAALWDFVQSWAKTWSAAILQVLHDHGSLMECLNSIAASCQLNYWLKDSTPTPFSRQMEHISVEHRLMIRSGSHSIIRFMPLAT